MTRENFETIERVSPSGFTYQVYKEIKESSKLTDDHLGKRVMVAGHKTTAKFYLKKIHRKGEKQHLYDDAYTVMTKSGAERCFDVDQCRLHPSEYRKGKRWQR